MAKAYLEPSEVQNLEEEASRREAEQAALFDF